MSCSQLAQNVPQEIPNRSGRERPPAAGHRDDRPPEQGGRSRPDSPRGGLFVEMSAAKNAASFAGSRCCVSCSLLESCANGGLPSAIGSQQFFGRSGQRVWGEHTLPGHVLLRVLPFAVISCSADERAKVEVGVLKDMEFNLPDASIKGVCE